MKRVYTLYRVSTKKQVDKNDKNQADIPMQKNACHEFASWQHEWEIVKEFSEMGVSGYKVSAEDRDAIQDLKEAALKGEFDVLLVFMFDRIGRIDDETPFIVEWFVKHGIEVWSSQEGQQRFETHVDKLTNYIRFWQASGESEKTSIRIRNKMQQMIMDGLYTGGPIRFGYRLADYLNKHGYKAKNGGKFTSIKISRILKDPYYCGRLEDGSTSPALAALQIRSEEDYEKILYILEQRNNANEEKRHIAMQTKSAAMLSGNVFCAHCGGRMTTMRYKDSYTRADGSVYAVDQLKYCCYHKARKLVECDGRVTYQANQVDEKVCRLMQKLFSSMAGAPEEDRIQEMFKRQMAGNRAKQRKLEMELRKSRTQLDKLQLEIGKSLTGDSVYTAEDLSQAIGILKTRISDSEKELSSLKEEEARKKQGVDKISPAYNQFKSWAEEFDAASMEEKKMIAGHLFNRIEVDREYNITVEMNMTYQQFCAEWADGMFLEEKPKERVPV